MNYLNQPLSPLKKEKKLNVSDTVPEDTSRNLIEHTQSAGHDDDWAEFEDKMKNQQ